MGQFNLRNSSESVNLDSRILSRRIDCTVLGGTRKLSRRCFDSSPSPNLAKFAMSWAVGRGAGILTTVIVQTNSLRVELPGELPLSWGGGFTPYTESPEGVRPVKAQDASARSGRARTLAARIGCGRFVCGARRRLDIRASVPGSYVLRGSKGVPRKGVRAPVNVRV